MLTSVELPKYRTKEEYAYDVLRRAILHCQLKPGEKLVADNLRAMLGISPIPIRAALQRLQAEGLVEITPHTGAVVSELSPGNFEPVSLLLERLEILAFEVAARRATPADIARLRQIVRELEDALAVKDMERWSELNIEFHSTVAAITQMKLLIEFSNRLLDAWTRLRRWYLPQIITQLPQAQAEHRKMVDLLARRDVVRLTKIAAEHSRRLREYAHQATANVPSQSAEPKSPRGARRRSASLEKGR
ncbi:MAG: GntR family transcriptional regulator [Chloroflexi bacterium]|nr:GntR family transcriptional regulator [Chloroflexota bacterium]